VTRHVFFPGNKQRAMLCAAAPDLAEALDNLLRSATHCPHDDDGHCDTCNLIRAGTAALKKSGWL
jgi:hypothetical protein